MQYLGNKPVQGISRTKNLIPFPYTKGNTMTGVNITVNSDGSVTLKGKTTSEAYFSLYGSWSEHKPITDLFEVGKTYTISDNGTTVRAMIYFYTDNGSRNFANKSFTVLESDREFMIFIYVGGAKTIDERVYPMLNEGATALPYQPYLQRYDMYMYDNLIKQPYFDGLSKTHNGITFTVDEQTGWITANGTTTANAIFYTISTIQQKVLPAGKYLMKGCPNNAELVCGIKIGANPRYTEYCYPNSTEIFTVTNDFIWDYQCLIRNGKTVNNLVFKPELIRLIGD